MTTFLATFLDWKRGKGGRHGGPNRGEGFDEPSDPADCASPKLADVLADEREDLAGQALRAVDWEDLRASLPPLESAALEALAQGRCLSATARKNGVCPSTLSTAKRKLAARIREAWGAAAIAEAARGAAVFFTMDPSRPAPMF